LSLFSFKIEKLGNLNFVYGIFIENPQSFPTSRQNNVFDWFIHPYPARVEQWQNKTLYMVTPEKLVQSPNITKDFPNHSFD